MKAYSAEALDALASGEAIVTGALAIYCDPPFLVWGGTGQIEIEGEIYGGIDDRSTGQISGGSIGAAEQNITLSLSGIDPESLALLESSSLRRASAKLYRMVFDGSGRKCLDCRVFKRGRLDDIGSEEVVGGTATITISIESAARGLGRSGQRMRSDADQRLIDPADGFFKHVSYAATKTIYFGGKPSSAAAIATAGGRGGSSFGDMLNVDQY